MWRPIAAHRQASRLKPDCALTHCNLGFALHLMEKAHDQVRPVIVKQMQHWQSDPDFAGVCGSQELTNLPEAERQPWEKLWADVADLLRQAQTNPPTENKAPTRPAGPGG